MFSTDFCNYKYCKTNTVCFHFGKFADYGSHIKLRKSANVLKPKIPTLCNDIGIVLQSLNKAEHVALVTNIGVDTAENERRTRCLMVNHCKVLVGDSGRLPKFEVPVLGEATRRRPR